MSRKTEILDALEKALNYKPSYLTTQTPWHGLVPVGYWLSKLCKPAVICELGVYRGDSFFLFYDANNHDNLVNIFAIDTWVGDLNTGEYGTEPFEQFISEVNRRNDYRIVYKKCSFEIAVTGFEDCSIDLLHIDGAHDYESVLSDFILWRGKISNRGIMLFHDISVMNCGFGVYKLWHEIKNDYPGRCLEIDYSNGLGILFYGNESPHWILDEIYSRELSLSISLLKCAGDVVRNIVNKERQVLEDLGLPVGLNWVFGRYGQAIVDNIYDREIPFVNWFQGHREEIYESLKGKVQEEIRFWLSINRASIYDLISSHITDHINMIEERIMVRTDKIIEVEIRNMRNELRSVIIAQNSEITALKQYIQQSKFRYKVNKFITRFIPWEN